MISVEDGGFINRQKHYCRNNKKSTTVSPRDPTQPAHAVVGRKSTTRVRTRFCAVGQVATPHSLRRSRAGQPPCGASWALLLLLKRQAGRAACCWRRSCNAPDRSGRECGGAGSCRGVAGFSSSSSSSSVLRSLLLLLSLSSARRPWPTREPPPQQGRSAQAPCPRFRARRVGCRRHSQI